MDWDSLLDDMTAVIAETFPKRITYHRAETNTDHDTTPTGSPLTGIYDIQSVDTRENSGTLTVTNRQIVLDVRLADLGFKPATKDGVDVQGEGSFTVLALFPSSSGMTKLQLRKA
jgi:flagellar basal body rod protein FlgG